MKILIIDWFNLIKRYNYQLEDTDDGTFIDEISTNILNRLLNCVSQHKPDLTFVCSDCGFNSRAASVVSGYKKNRKKHKSLTEEEKEKSYIEHLKKLVMTLPFPFIEVKNVEADMIIYCLIEWTKKKFSDVDITLASSDSDFIQLLDKDLKIFDWYKGNITDNNWWEKHKSIGTEFNVKDYALAKSIVGDKSDNVIGVPNLGWKKVIQLFRQVRKHLTESYEFSNCTDIINGINVILNKYSDELDKKELKYFNKYLELLTSTQDKIDKNQRSN